MSNNKNMPPAPTSKGGMSCKKGEVVRIAYTNKKGTRVSATCEKDRGLLGKTPESRKIPFRNAAFTADDLGKYGYSDIVHKTASQRHAALSGAVKEYGSVPVLRKINVLDVLSRHANPTFGKKLENDKVWIENTYHTNKRKVYKK